MFLKLSGCVLNLSNVTHAEAGRTVVGVDADGEPVEVANNWDEAAIWAALATPLRDSPSVRLRGEDARLFWRVMDVLARQTRRDLTDKAGTLV